MNKELGKVVICFQNQKNRSLNTTDLAVALINKGLQLCLLSKKIVDFMYQS